MRTLRPALLAIALMITGSLLVPDPAAGEDWLRAEPGFSWSFPRDHWTHPGFQSEWWYVTGHLQAEEEPGQRFGFQFTFFRIGLLPTDVGGNSIWATRELIMGHASVTDLTAGEHRFGEILYRGIPLLGGFNPHPSEAIAWSIGPPGSEGPWTLHWNGRAFDLSARDNGAGFSLTLSTRPTRPLVLHGDDGFSRKGGAADSGASHYYSFTRLDTSGTITLDGRSWKVRGLGWMDKEFGTSQLSRDQAGWDWFSLQLDDGRDLMLYVLRDRMGETDHASGTLVWPDGSSRTLQASEFELRVLDTWRSPISGGEYPAAWQLEIPGEGLRFRVEPELADQENRARLAGGLAYWEGAVRVRDEGGESLGQGYVELTGYAGEGGLGFLRDREPAQR